MRVMEQIDDYAAKAEVPMELRTYLRTTAAQVTSQLRYEGASAVARKTVARWDRALAKRTSELGYTLDDGARADPKAPPAPIRTRLTTQASVAVIQRLACTFEMKVPSEDGTEQYIRVEGDGFLCPASPVGLAGDKLFRVIVSIHAGDASNEVVVELQRSAELSEEDAADNLRDIAKELRRRCDAAMAAPKAAVSERGPEGTNVGDSCVAPAEPGVHCESPLVCDHGTCRLRKSASLMRTTGTAAKWGLILLIPPICAIGILVLFVCLIMVIVAGIESATGD